MSGQSNKSKFMAILIDDRPTTMEDFKRMLDSHKNVDEFGYFVEDSLEKEDVVV